jgi:hypothetical protein
MCGVAVRKETKHPLEDAAPPATASKLKKKKVEAPAVVSCPPQDPPPRTHSSGVVVDVVGTNKGDRGCSCEEHPDGCGAAVLADDVVVRIRKEQILVEDYLLGKGRMKEETALTVNWVSDGIDRCRVGFLRKVYVPHAKLWDGALCQVVFVGVADDPSLSFRSKFHHCYGYARVAVISALAGDVKVVDDVKE